MPKNWKTLSEKLIAPCRVFDVYEKRMQHPSGREGDFYVLKVSDWVHILPLTADNRLVMVQQFRFGIDALCWEIPGGIIDLGEKPVEAGVRELEEETGYGGADVRIIGSCYPNPGMQNNLSYFVLINNCTELKDPKWDHHEEIFIQCFPLEEVYGMTKQGKIQHSITLTGLLYLQLALSRPGETLLY